MLQVYEPLEIVEQAVVSVLREESEFSQMQQKALGQFRKLIARAYSNKNSLLRRLGSEDPAKEVTEAEVKHLLDLINRIFFLGRLYVDFKWEDIEKTIHIDCLGYYMNCNSKCMREGPV